MRYTQFLLSLVATVALVGCSATPNTPESRETLKGDARSAIARLTSADPGLQGLLDQSAGYAIFPNVGKGAVGIGGAFGEGVVYDHDRVIGYSDIKQGTIGLQAGGQSYMELVVFQTPGALDRFKSGTYS